MTKSMTNNKRRMLLAGMTLAPLSKALGAASIALPSIPSNGQPIIDVHTHIFNAHDATVAGYFTNAVLHELEKAHPKLKRLLSFAKYLLPAINGLKLFAPSIRDEIEDLTKIRSKAVLADAQKGRMDLMSKDLQIGTRQQIVKDRYIEVLSSIEGKQAYGNAVKEHNDFTLKTQGIRRDTPTAITRRQIDQLFDPQAPYRLEEFDYSWTPALGLVEFGARMLSHRSTNVVKFFNTYPQVSAMFSAMVNFDGWYEDDGKANSSLEEQIELMNLINWLTDHRMMPIVAFNPLRDVRSSGKHLELCTNAIERHGFIGIKLYPPNGFSPNGKVIPKSLDVPQNSIRDSLLRMYHMAADHGVPVMAHSFHSLGETDEKEDLADPKWWKEVLTLVQSTNDKLRINVAHMTAFSGAEGKEHWAENLREVFLLPNAGYVMSDLAYHNEFLDCAGDKNCIWERTKMIEFLSSDLTKAPERKRIISRCMYGSDWYMLVREKSYGNLYPSIVTALKLTGEELADFSYKNALRLFGLDSPSAQTYARLVRLYGKVPDWLAPLL